MDLNQITLPSRDLNESVRFYQTLGLRLIVDSVPRYARFECPNGASSLSLHYTDQVPTGAGIWVYFECEDLDQQVASLKQKGITFESDPEDQDWLWREARLKDPDGHQVILYYAGKNRLNPPWKVQ